MRAFKREHFLSIPSTHLWVKDHISLFEDGFDRIVTASKQTAGIGRFSREWKDYENQSLLVSFACLIEKNKQQSYLNGAQILALSMAKELENRAVPISIVWPNDLMIKGKKVGGLLGEIVHHQDFSLLIMSIGVNVNQSIDFFKDIDQPASSLKEAIGYSLVIEELFQSLQKRFIQDFSLFEEKGFFHLHEQFSAFLEDYQKQEIRFLSGNQVWKGAIKAFNPDGSVTLRMESGDSKTFFSGEFVNP